ncbi:MAG: hypothetical protein VYA30_12740 [Myxococcota bacterium]|nr:hypothetical protein [Myxococcota bacterium]
MTQRRQRAKAAAEYGINVSKRCRHCGALISSQKSAESGVCVVCGRMLDIEPTVPELADTPSVGNEILVNVPVNSQAETLGLELGARLGPLPTDSDDIDISALLDGQGNPSAASETAAPWRIRTTRGVIYEAASIDEVAQHVQNSDDPSRLDVARGLAPFRAIDSYAEFTALLTDSSQIRGSMSDLLEDMSVAASMDSSVDAVIYEDGASSGSLQLDLQTASHRHAGVLGHRETRHAISSQVPTLAGSDSTSDKRLGFGFAASILFVCIGFALTNVGRLKADRQDQPDGQPLVVIAKFESKQIERAQKAIEAGSYTTAAKILEGLSKRSKNPVVFKNLAIALARTNRPSEAKRALDTYRRLVNREKKK